MSDSCFHKSFNGGKAILVLKLATGSILFLLFLLLSVQYKVPDQEAIRPFYQIGLILLFVFFFVLFARSSRVSRVVIVVNNLQSLILFFIFLYIISSALFSGERQIKDGLYFIYWVVLLFLMFIYLQDLYPTISDLSNLLSHVLVVFSLISSILALLVYFDLFSIEIGNYVLEQNACEPLRIHGFLGEPTSFGSLIGLGVICLVHLRLHRKRNYLSWLLFAFFALCLIWSGSRNGILSVFVSLFVYIILDRNLNLRRLIGSCTMMLILVSIAFFVISEMFVWDYKNIFIALDRGDFAYGAENNRFTIWTSVLSFYKEGPVMDLILGRGSGSIREIYRAAFNTPLEILFDYGLIILIGYLSFITLVFYVGWKKYHESFQSHYRLALAFLTYSIVFSQFLSNFPSPFFNFPIFALFIALFLINLPISSRRAFDADNIYCSC